MKDPNLDAEITFEKIRRKTGHGRVHATKIIHLPLCKGKHSYKRKENALRARSKLLAMQAADFLRIYECLKCPYWHLTSKKRYGR